MYISHVIHVGLQLGICYRHMYWLCPCYNLTQKSSVRYSVCVDIYIPPQLEQLTDTDDN
jgi:hypothetical protein